MGTWASRVISGFRVWGLGAELLEIRRPWGACWMVAEGGEGENPLPFGWFPKAELYSPM